LENASAARNTSNKEAVNDDTRRSIIHATVIAINPVCCEANCIRQEKFKLKKNKKKGKTYIGKIRYPGNKWKCLAGKYVEGRR
jgi:hypothetical protein